MNQATMQTCDECKMTGHPSKRCNNGKVVSFNLLGVQIDPNLSHEDDHNRQGVIGNSIRKCKSMEILNVCNNEHTSMDRGYLSDEHPDHRKKGVPWTEDEHISFLIGLEKLGKGDWRGISKNYVPTRTPTQVASHAQKYFIRMNASQEKPKRRSSLFDIPINESPKIPIAPPTTTSTSTRPPVSRIRRTYDVRDYAYMHMGYQNRNEQRFGDHKFSPMLPFVPVMSFPNQGRVYPLNSGLPTQLFTARFPFVSQVPLPITRGDGRITEERTDRS